APAHQSSGEEELRLLGSARRLGCVTGDRCLEEGDRGRLGGDAEINPENLAQSLEDANGRRPVTVLEVAAHQVAAGLLISGLHLYHPSPEARCPDHLKVDRL